MEVERRTTQGLPSIGGALTCAGLLSVGMYSQVNGMRDFGNRVEGKDVRKNALEELTVLALHRGPVKFEKGTNLYVAFFGPPITGFQPPRLLIEALELQDTGEHYSMRA